MADYEETYREEEERVKAHESRVVELLEAISRSLEHAQNLPSQQDHQSLKSDLAFKTREMKNSKATAQALEVRVGNVFQGGAASALILHRHQLCPCTHRRSARRAPRS